MEKETAVKWDSISSQTLIPIIKRELAEGSAERLY